MIPLFVGILLLLAIFGIFYFFRSSGGNTPNQSEKIIQPGILKEDIVLALLTDSSNPYAHAQASAHASAQYAILWNGTPNSTYSYTIIQDGIEIAKGESTSESSVFKIKGIPLEQGKTYTVQVEDTKVEIPFIPPIITGINMSEKSLDINTDVVPTNIEVMVSASKISLNECQIKIDPPGFVCKLPENVKPVVVIYNGPNAVNILM